jgi:hypothetical protein
MKQIYASLYVVPLDEEWNKKTCNYWYLVHNHAFSHTAFTTQGGLLRWIRERGLHFDATKLPPVHTYAPPIKIEGSYEDQMHMSYDEFYSLPNVVLETREMSNGQYTLARITEDVHGVRCVHTLNPNCKHRMVFDYRESQEMMK